MSSDIAQSAGSSSATVAAQRNVHFLVLVHGMWGNPEHLAECARIIKESKELVNDQARELEILVAETNREESTYDGFDWGGERVAEEVLDAIRKIEDSGRKVTHFSVTGYSLGGLIARYMIGILYQRGFFETHQPCNFNTFATPHIGLPRYNTWFSKLSNFLGPHLLSRSGEQFFAVDKWSQSGRPLLEVMADPNRIFYKALSVFPNITIYANAVNDRTVPYVTSAIETEDIFFDYKETGLEVEFDDKYKPIISSWQHPAIPPTKKTKPRPFSKKWFKDIKNHKPLVPPFLQFKFPGNLLIYAAWPLLFPTFITLAIIRLSLSARNSRKRVALLEKEDSYSNRLVHVVAAMEKEVEDTIVDMFNDPGVSASTSTSGVNTPTPIASPSPEATAERSLPRKKNENGPILSDTQRKIAGWLNTIPGLKKELAFFAGAINAHAMIVSRDVKRFAYHRDGEGVIRHWADHFEI